MVLQWHENLEEAEIPPEYLWGDGEGLELWWKTVEDRRKNDDPTSGGSREASGGDDHQDGGMAENDYARSLRN